MFVTKEEEEEVPPTHTETRPQQEDGEEEGDHGE